MFGILVTLLLAWTTFFVCMVLAYRLVLTEQYETYSETACAEGRPYSWVRFFWVRNLASGKGSQGEPTTFPQFLLIAALTLPPTAAVFHFLG